MKLLEHPVFSLLSLAAKNTGNEAYVVGGYVRDTLLGLPSKDIDIVLTHSMEAYVKNFRALLKRKPKITIFKTYGTAHIRFEEFDIEFVNARKESYTQNSRNPLVQQGTLYEDQCRRDFTINAMSFSLQKGNFGELIDPFGGEEDLKQGIVKTPQDPEKTFFDDPLRILRAIRFATTYGFDIEEKTFLSLSKNKERLTIISKERVCTELHKMILARKPSKGFLLLQKSGILESLLPELIALDSVETKNGISHKNNFYHTLEVVDNISKRSESLWLRWAGVFHDIGKPATKRFDKSVGWTFYAHDFIGGKMLPKIFQRLGFPKNKHLKYVQKMVFLHLRPIALCNKSVSASGIRRLLFDAGDDIDDLMILCESDITSKNENKVKHFKKNFLTVRKELKEVEEKDRIKNFQPPIDGNRIMEIFDVEPSRSIALLKNSIKEAILDGKVENTSEAALEFALEKAKDFGISKRGTPLE